MNDRKRRLRATATSPGRIAAALLVARLAGDFVFQTDAMAKQKRQTATLLNHAAIHALLAYGAVGRGKRWIGATG